MTDVRVGMTNDGGEEQRLLLAIGMHTYMQLDRHAGMCMCSRSTIQFLEMACSVEGPLSRLCSGEEPAGLFT